MSKKLLVLLGVVVIGLYIIYGGPALRLASKNGSTKIVKALINIGAKVNAKDIYGTTALMLASGKGKTETVKLLIDAGANVNAKNKWNGMEILL